MKKIGLWSFMVGLVLAVATVFIDLGNWANQALIILGILTGIFHDFKNDLIRLGIVYLALSAASDTLQNLIGIGPVFTDIAEAWVRFLGPVVLTALLVWGTPYLLTKRKP